MEKLTDLLDRPIVLVGLMGAGKSTVGRRLARRLGLPFVDSDVEIEEASGATTADLFERFGEHDFRDGERRLVARLMNGDVRVIATGGGAFMDSRTRQLLNDRAITVWLDAPIDVLAERTARRDNRPLLKQGNRADILSRLSDERRASYSEAQIHIHSSGGAHGEVIEAILAALRQRLGG